MTQYDPHESPLDLRAIRHGMARVRVRGRVMPGKRAALIEEAVAILQANPERMRDGYLGIKNYAGFGDQREDHGYGMRPRHGTIVFSIEMPGGRLENSAPMTSDEVADAIYYLLAERDFAGVEEEATEGGYKVRRWRNLGDCVAKMDAAGFEFKRWTGIVSKAKPAPESAEIKA